MTTPLIDAHHHLWPASVIDRQGWRPAQDAAIRRAFLPTDFEAVAPAAGVTGSVLMQSVDEPDENDRLFDFAKTSALIRGVVAWAPLIQPAGAAAVIRTLVDAADPAFVGLRCLVGTTPLDWATSAAGIANFELMAEHGIAWDIVPLTVDQADAVVEVARRVPALRIVVDHLAAPPLAGGSWADWQRNVDALAAEPGIAMKLSVGIAVLDAWDRWDAELLRPAFERALAAFGARRCMLASNWPVVLLRADYPTVVTDSVQLVEELLGNEADLASVKSGTATEWYGLDRAGTR